MFMLENMVRGFERIHGGQQFELRNELGDIILDFYYNIFTNNWFNMRNPHALNYF